MSTLDTTAPKLAEFLDWFELGVRDDTPGDIVYHKSLWQEVESGVWQVRDVLFCISFPFAPLICLCYWC